MPHSTQAPTLADNVQYGDWRDDMFRDGYAVVKGAVPPERCEKYIDDMYAWLEKFPYGFKRDDKSTWTPEHLPANMKGGMYYHYSVQHEAFVWRARQEPGVLDAFSLLWGTDKLIASFDGINFTLPTSARAPWKAWPHIDQSPYRTGLQCAQGIINFSPNGPKDGGLVVLKGSHKLTESYFECHEKDQKTWGSTDWFGFTPEQVEWFKERGCEEIKVCADPGDLIVWDSRTMHHNVVPEGDQTRALVYACYAPAKFAKQETLEKKKEFFEKRIGTTHWPHDNIFISSYSTARERCGKPDEFDRDRPFEEPEINDTVLRLAGVLSYDE
ncbi:Phytanoyl-CoA dioxygenase [Botryosphaeria dothidea]|uniref:Phytanoyl-CoA dioxygenase n=1 Tax=Botryosphaeria dothidea TaxID=55169 RepID=A0A8H4N7B2_9PEZI|nr:Phytanoyl-CoA dioxygenase [Botryosphaeria dothidea]